MKEKVWVCDDEGSARFPVFTRGNVGEVFAEAVSPLTWSTLGVHALEPGYRDGLCEMGVFTPQEFKPEGQCEVIGCFGGYVYINMSVARVFAMRIPGLTTEAIDASFFEDHANVPPYRPDPRDRNAERMKHANAWVASLFTANPNSSTVQDASRINALIARLPQFTTMADAQLLSYFRSLVPEMRYLLYRHILNTYGCNVLTGLIAQHCHAVSASDCVSKVTAGIGDVVSASQSLDLWRLSRQVKALPAVMAAFDDGVEGLLDRLRHAQAPDAMHFLSRWDEFIDRWGFIGPNVWELRSPSYRTNPEIPLRMLDRARQAPDCAAPSERTEALGAAREAAVAEVSNRLADNSDTRKQFIGAARAAGRYLAARERSKMHCTRLIDTARAPLRELGYRLTRRGQLSRWEDVLLLTDDEIDAFVVDPAAYRKTVAERAARLELLKSKEPPFVFEGDPPPLSDFKDRSSTDDAFADAGGHLGGIGVSPGRHTGRARVIASLAEESSLEPGEVIVAATTDASWGPLLLAAGAIVVETGSVISHCAIVARELGIPAVASVSGATQRIKNGTRITVDGNAGTVTIH